MKFIPGLQTSESSSKVLINRKKTYSIDHMDQTGIRFFCCCQNEMSLFLENRRKTSIEITVSTFRIVAYAAAGPSDPRDTIV